MNIDNYVKGVLKDDAFSISFPDTLELSKDLAGDFYRLYEEGERRGIEVAHNMMFQNGRVVIDKTEKFDGTAYSVDIKWKQNEKNCGDLHSHPANSLGHIQGYCAHSIQDIRAINNNEDKKLFIRFVASGYYTYAMVYRKGHSALDVNALSRLADVLSNEQKTYMLKKNSMSEDDYIDTMSSFGSQNEIDQWALNTRRKTPGLGPKFQRLSVKYCIRVAKDMKLGFYAGYRGLGGWIWGSQLTLDKQ